MRHFGWSSSWTKYSWPKKTSYLPFTYLTLTSESGKVNGNGHYHLKRKRIEHSSHWAIAILKVRLALSYPGSPHWWLGMNSSWLGLSYPWESSSKTLLSLALGSWLWKLGSGLWDISTFFFFIIRNDLFLLLNSFLSLLPLVNLGARTLFSF